MEELNLISCTKHMKKIIHNLNVFVDKECNSIYNMPLQNVEGLKDGYMQILWMENEYNKMLKEIKNIKEKYNNLIESIMTEINYTIIRSENDKRESLRLPGLDLYYQLHNFNNTWGEEQEYADNIYDIISMKLESYPMNQGEKIIKKIINNPYSTGVGKSKNELLNKEKVTVDNIQKNHIIGEYKYNIGDTNITLPIIDSLVNIPPCMYYYSNENGVGGVFMKIAHNIIVEVPMVDVIPEDMDFSRDKTLKCRNGDKCNYFSCVFAHNGVQYNKVGYKNRCPSNPGFSNKDTLKTDIRYVSYNDIRMCLLYNTTDLLSIIAWCQHQRYSNDENIIITNLDICGDYKDPFSTMPE